MLCADAEVPRLVSAALLRVLATHEDSLLRLWRVMKEWDWSPLFGCLGLQVGSEAAVLKGNIQRQGTRLRLLRVMKKRV